MQDPFPEEPLGAFDWTARRSGLCRVHLEELQLYRRDRALRGPDNTEVGPDLTVHVRRGEAGLA